MCVEIDECCGEKRDSNFCPDCGRQLHSYGTLTTLLVYIRARQSHAKRVLDEPRPSQCSDDKWRRHCEKCGKTFDKFTGWVQAVEQMIEDRKSQP